MGFYKNLKDNKDTDFSKEERKIEEDYQKLFPKIARDFICRRDVEKTFNNILSVIDSDDNDLNEKLNSIRHALLIAREYKLNLKKPISERKNYKDIDELIK
tara:strand:+ start:136 stop:438 length:303 start_codon:yes stop_codon:yes gene_type:complete